jgi:hypothetical protein
VTRLCNLAMKYGTDKVGAIFHDYTPFYDDFLGGRQMRRVLEIGIGTAACMNHMVKGGVAEISSVYQPGASLRMWRDYFPTAVVWGLDNDPSAMVTDIRIQSMLCDQGSEESLLNAAAKMGGKFDLIIDDGSHQLEHQILTAKTLIPALLSSTGVYIIEDVIWRKELYAQLPFPVEVKIFNLKRTCDDCLFIVEGVKL